MVLPLVPILAGTVGGTVLGGSVLGKKEYTTTYQAPYNTYSPTNTYAPQTSIAYTSGARIYNSPHASASERVGLSTGQDISPSNSTLGGLNPNKFIPIILVIGGVGVVLNLTKKK